MNKKSSSTLASEKRFLLVRPISFFLVLFLFLIVATTSSSAQQDVGYISGTVIDTSGGRIAGAKVHIENSSTGIAQNIVSDGVGFYQSEPLAPGQYVLSVQVQGFSTADEKGLAVDAAAHVTANITLKLGSVSTSVSVESTPPALDTVDAQISNTVDARAAQDLPVNGRSVLALATLSPGVESAVGPVSEGFTNRGTQTSAIRISGGVEGGNNSLLDGVTNLQDYLGEVAINLKSDSIQEFRIMSGVIPAQFGYTSGGVINAITRAGTNRFHGSLYEFFRNDALDAEIAFPRPVFGKPETRFNNYGGTFGGPIRKNRAFFFTNYEEYRYISDAPYYSTVPTLQERGGDFTDLGQVVNGVCTPVNLYDPAQPTSTSPRTQFMSSTGVLNVIPTGRLDSVAVAAQNLFYPLPNNSTGTYDSCTHANNYIANPKIVSNERTGIIRVDDSL
jgi:hypothetical protein